jgi:phosphoesterase RecJ-like protein
MINFAKINVVEPLSSTCLLLYYYIKQLVEFNDNIACSLYSGMASDTGCFMHSNTTYLEHEICAELTKYNFDLFMVNFNLFKRKTIQQVNLQKIAFNNLKFYLDGKLAIISLSLKDFQITKSIKNDTTGFPDYLAGIDNVLVGVIISEEKKGLFTCSFRSSSNVDVSLIAESFGGGGHAKAAGCNVFGHLNTVIKKIVLAVEKEVCKDL